MKVKRLMTKTTIITDNHSLQTIQLYHTTNAESIANIKKQIRELKPETRNEKIKKIKVTVYMMEVK